MKVPILGLAIAAFMCVSARAQTPATAPLEKSRTFVFEQMQPHTNANGSESRPFFTGILATGEAVSVHESVQPAGTTPPALHKIQHSELIVIQEGTVEYHHNGVVERAGPGSILYVKIGTDHFVANVGDGPAKYAVIAIGGDVKK
ncbi:MAG TPA: cupin domain-containing protein [Candidatus Angelobacter sp.]|jgi:quercetin dioxygenase-like cupin family protein|nr:cupin domain-containing protein [Candidatus Angelobacter sp.]